MKVKHNYIFLFILLFSLSFVSKSFASTPSVYLEGNINAIYADTSQSKEYEQNTLPSSPANSNDNNLTRGDYITHESEISVRVEGKSDNEVIYGGQITFESDAYKEDHANRDGVYSKRTYLYSEKKEIGRGEIGHVEGAAEKMQISGASISVASGGVGGSWYKFINIPVFNLNGNDPASNGGQGEKSFILKPYLPTAHGYTNKSDFYGTGQGLYGPSPIDDTASINRVSLYSPRIAGIQAGMSYSPDSGNRGSTVFGDGISGELEGDIKDIFDLGLNYSKQMGHFGFGLSLTGQVGNPEVEVDPSTTDFKQNDLAAYSFGTKFIYRNFSLAGSFSNWGDSLMYVDNTISSSDPDYRKDEAYSYDIAMAYEIGPVALSTGYFFSDYRGQELTLVSIGGEYRLARGLTFYAEGNIYNFDVLDADETVATTDNKGHVLLMGVNLSF